MLEKGKDGTTVPFHRVVAPDLILRWADSIATDLSLCDLPRIYMVPNRKVVTGVAGRPGMGMHIINPHRMRANVLGEHPGEDPLIILAGKYDGLELFKTLAHELRHHWQFTSGTCIFLARGNYRWRGEQFPGISNQGSYMATAYEKRPWEIDATQYEGYAASTLYRVEPLEEI